MAKRIAGVLIIAAALLLGGTSVASAHGPQRVHVTSKKCNKKRAKALRKGTAKAWHKYLDKCTVPVRPRPVIYQPPPRPRPRPRAVVNPHRPRIVIEAPPIAIRINLGR